MTGTSDTKNVCVFWTKSREYYQTWLGLREQAEFHYKSGFTSTVHALCAEGFDLIPDEIEYLHSLGYVVHDCSQEFSRLKNEFPKLGQAKWEFHFYNLLRWLLIGRIFANEHVLCFDADLTLNTPTRSIIDDNDGKTFMVGSTCFVHISDDRWFRGFEETLRRYDNDIDRFWEDWQQKAKDPFLKITTEADIDEERFVRFCVEEQFVPNTWTSNSSSFLYIPFFVYLNGPYYPFQFSGGRIDMPASYTRVGRSDCFNGKPLAFVHYQQEFSYLLGNFLLQKYFLQVERPVPSLPQMWRGILESYRNETTLLNHLRDKLAREADDAFKYLCRSYQVKYFTMENDFSEIFTDEYWFGPGTFPSAASR